MKSLAEAAWCDSVVLSGFVARVMMFVETDKVWSPASKNLTAKLYMFGLSPSEPCRNGWSDRDAVCVKDSGGLRKHLLHIAVRFGRILYCAYSTQSQPSSCFWDYVITPFPSCYSARSYSFAVYWIHFMAMFTRSAITPPEVKRFGWQLGHSEYIDGLLHGLIR